MDPHTKDGLKDKITATVEYINYIYILYDNIYVEIEHGMFSISAGRSTVSNIDLVNLDDSKHRVLS